MKNKSTTSIMILLLGYVLVSGTLIAQPDDEGPSQAMPNPIAWKKLNTFRNVKGISISHASGNKYAMNMGGIRNLLERAGMSETVSIYAIIDSNDKNPILLGKYSPVTKKSSKPTVSKSTRVSTRRAVTAAKPSWKYSNIPSTKQFTYKAAVKTGSSGRATAKSAKAKSSANRVTKVKFIFKDTKGKTRASLTGQCPVPGGFPLQ